MPKIIVELDQTIYNYLSQIVTEEKSFNRIMNVAASILTEKIVRTNKRQLETGNWEAIVSTIDENHRKNLIEILKNLTKASITTLRKHKDISNLQDLKQVLRTIILFEYLAECLDNEEFNPPDEIDDKNLDEEIEYWQQKGFKVPKALLNENEQLDEKVIGIRFKACVSCGKQVYAMS